MMAIQLLFGACLILCVVFGGIGMFLFKRTEVWEKRCSAQTIGVIVKTEQKPLDHMRNIGEKPLVSWFAWYEYQVHRDKFQKKTQYGTMRPHYTVGQSVVVWYDPSEPECSMIGLDGINKINRIFFIIAWCLGFAAFVTGLILFL